jgi:hypothetical protein
MLSTYDFDGEQGFAHIQIELIYVFGQTFFIFPVKIVYYLINFTGCNEFSLFG